LNQVAEILGVCPTELKSAHSVLLYEVDPNASAKLLIAEVLE